MITVPDIRSGCARSLHELTPAYVRFDLDVFFVQMRVQSSRKALAGQAATGTFAPTKNSPAFLKRCIFQNAYYFSARLHAR